MYKNTHFDESMKYITRAPILRAKTKTTYKRKEQLLRVLEWNSYRSTHQHTQAKDKENES